MPHSKAHKQRTKGATAMNGDSHGFDHDDEDKAKGDESIACCLPKGCPLKTSVKLSNAVRVICNNEHCKQSSYMHGECFETFEDDILTYLRGTGRARSWSEKQRRQNIWTKKGYDLAYKSCACLCGKGHLRKDLEFQPPQDEEESGGQAQAAKGKRRKKTKSNEKPAVGLAARVRRSSQSSNCESPPERSPVSPQPKTPVKKSKSSENCHFFGDGFTCIASVANSCVNFASKFLKRSDFSSFQAVLPKHKVNPYHIKMDDEGTDQARHFVLSNLSTSMASTVCCVLCNRQLPVFDKFPLIDGTFFLTPRQLTPVCLDVSHSGRAQYLSAVCMYCLEGSPDSVKCKLCKKNWDGSNHQLGTMYTYDIFAASPCCQQRVACQSCGKPVVDLQSGMHFFSEYSQSIKCPHCGITGYHCIKSVSSFFDIPIR